MGILRKLALASLLIVLLTSCGPRYIKDAYFHNVVEQADQEQVTLQIGPPVEVKQNVQGGEEWIYRDYQPNYPTQALGTCTEYRLKFDANKVFRDWKRTRCPNRG